MSEPREADRPAGSHNELWLGLYVGFLVNLATAAALSNTFWEASAAVWLMTLGAANELLGVLLVASPELLPRLRRVCSLAMMYLRRVSRRVVIPLMQLLKLPMPRTFIEVGGIKGEANVSGDLSLLRGGPVGGTQEQLIAYLLEQDKRHQERLNTIEQRLGKLPAEWRKDLDEVRAELKGLSRTLVRALADVRIRLRLLGLAYVIAGIVLSWLGNLV